MENIFFYCGCQTRANIYSKFFRFTTVLKSKENPSRWVDWPFIAKICTLDTWAPLISLRYSFG